MIFGALIVSGFAVFWTAAGAQGLSRRWFALLVVASVFISAAIVFAAARFHPLHTAPFNAKAYIFSVAFEAIFIGLAVVFLTRTNRRYLLLPVISVIVGLHFFGMVWALGSSEYWWIGSMMCFLPVLTMSALRRELWMPVVGLGCAVILWASIIWWLF